MFLRTETITEKKIIGKRLTMSFAENTTGQLFASFMPRRNEIQNRANSDLLCVTNYPPGFFQGFSPTRPFEKWAAAEVTTDSAPAEMETMTIPGGEYAVFLFKGTPANAGPFFQNIFANWFPASGYVVDDRPHFDVLGSKYKNNDPESEEEIFIPVRKV
jgi:AraC family transcriptional regulator